MASKADRAACRSPGCLENGWIRIAPDVLRALLWGVGGNQGLVLAEVIELTWGAAWWTRASRGGEKPDSEPAKINIAKLGRSSGVWPSVLSAAKSKLIASGILTAHADGRVEPSKRYDRWRCCEGDPLKVAHFRAGTESMDLCRANFDTRMRHLKASGAFADNAERRSHGKSTATPPDSSEENRRETTTIEDCTHSETTTILETDRIETTTIPECTHSETATIFRSETATISAPPIERVFSLGLDNTDRQFARACEGETDAANTTPPAAEAISPKHEPKHEPIQSPIKADSSPQTVAPCRPAPLAEGGPSRKAQILAATPYLPGDESPDERVLEAAAARYAEWFPASAMNWGDAPSGFIRQIRRHRYVYPSAWFLRLLRRFFLEGKYADPGWPLARSYLQRWQDQGGPDGGIEDQYDENLRRIPLSQRPLPPGEKPTPGPPRMSPADAARAVARYGNRNGQTVPHPAPDDANGERFEFPDTAAGIMAYSQRRQRP